MPWLDHGIRSVTLDYRYDRPGTIAGQAGNEALTRAVSRILSSR
jgi:hypothetical protein